MKTPSGRPRADKRLPWQTGNVSKYGIKMLEIEAGTLMLTQVHYMYSLCIRHSLLCSKRPRVRWCGLRAFYGNADISVDVTTP